MNCERTLRRHARKRVYDRLALVDDDSSLVEHVGDRALENEHDDSDSDLDESQDLHLEENRSLFDSNETGVFANYMNYENIHGGDTSDDHINQHLEKLLTDILDDNEIAQAASDSEDESEDDNTTIREEVRDWAISCKVPLQHVNALLNRLRKYHPELPKDARTLLGTPLEYAVETVAGGKFHYFSIKSNLEYLLQDDPVLSETDSLNIQCCIDGLPLFRSSNEQFWPILGKIEEQKNGKPFVIALWIGNSKPADSNEFMNSFVLEMTELQHGGLILNGKNYSVNVSNFVCDTPARSFVKKTKGHTGYSGCDGCITSGKYVESRVTFPKLKAPERTDVQFDEMVDYEHHKGASVLRTLEIGMVSQFPLDYMHLVCLGVMRKLLLLWMVGPLSVRVGGRVVKLISNSLVSFQSCLPREFVRKGRSLSEVDRWKATEFRTFLLYTGIVALKGKIDGVLYKNFLMLHVAITILCSQELSSQVKFCDYSKRLLLKFVKHFGKVYGSQTLIYNVHSLIHLPRHVKKFGSLENFSAFPFENYLKDLKRMIRNPRFPLQQVIRRLHEMKMKCSKMNQACVNFPLKREHNVGPLPFGFPRCTQYYDLDMGQFVVSKNERDHGISVDGVTFIIFNIVHVHDSGKIQLLGRKFCSYHSFYNYPIDSKKLHIYFVKHLGADMSIIDPADVSCKVILLPYDDGYVSIPVIHSVN